MKNINKSYIGDGLYVSYDGYGIWLEANNPTTDKIYLEPLVLDSLINYAKRLRQEEIDTDPFEIDE